MLVLAILLTLFKNEYLNNFNIFVKNSIITSMSGRPSKYDPTKNCDVIKLMSEGASIVEVAGLLNITRETIYDWTNPDSPRYNKEFSYTIKKGLNASQIWWEKQGRINLENKDFNYTGWYMNMKNRFRNDWQEVNKNVNQNQNTNFNQNVEVSEKEAIAIKKALDAQYKGVKSN